MSAENYTYVERIERLLRELGISQAELARLAGVDQSSVSGYLAGRREPGKIPALIFAGLSRNLEDRTFWLDLAAVSREQADLIAKALDISSPVLVEGSYDQEIILAFLRFWNSPQNEVREKVKDLLQSMIFGHLPQRKGS